MDEKFREQHISSFDFQVLSKNSKKITATLLGDQDLSIQYKGPDYAIIICDNRPHLKKTAELLFMGQLVGSNERWEFYNAEKFERPSKRELKDLKGIIIPSSDYKIKNKVPKEDSFVKEMLKTRKEKGDKSDLGHESSRSIDDDIKNSKLRQ